MKLGIISDIHEDIVRLNKALELCYKHSCDEIACLGDIVGFSLPHYAYEETRNASACIRLVRDNCSIVLAGNHDQYAIRKTPASLTGTVFPHNWYHLPFIERKKMGKDKVWLYEEDELPSEILKDDATFIDLLPEYLIREPDGLRILFSHFLSPDFTGSRVYFPENAGDLKNHFAFMEKNSCNLSVCGHYHSNGIIWSSRKKMEFKPFGTYVINENPLWLVAPSVANGTHENGIMILDTVNYELNVIPLKTKPIPQRQSIFF